MMEFIRNIEQEIYHLLKEISTIDAFSYHEEKRARYCLDYVLTLGYSDAFIDNVNNVIVPINLEEKNNIYMAHLDTVFKEINQGYVEENGFAFYPGIGDDTANVVLLLLTLKYFKWANLPLPHGMIFCFNSCEEGLGNLNGSKEIYKRYAKRINEVISFDGCYDGIVNQAVGSYRYQIDMKTEGGHSFDDFGNRSAIYEISKLIVKLYELPIPKNGKSTYNVGIVNGGHSVNSIAETSSCLFEIRSDNADSLKELHKEFMNIVEGLDNVKLTLLGERPCMSGVDAQAQKKLTNLAKKVILDSIGVNALTDSGSTDCNTFLSNGIPAIAFGGYMGYKAHTKEEYLELDSLRKGLEIIIKFIMIHNGQ